MTLVAPEKTGMSHRATPKGLVGYKPLYKGRRYWIFENAPLKPYEGWTGDWKILAYDRLGEFLAACGNFKTDGTICAEILWGQGVSFGANDLRGMASYIKYLEQHYR
jgi:hypothetical protein